jgi:hypothetical protein
VLILSGWLTCQIINGMLDDTLLLNKNGKLCLCYGLLKE